MGRDTKLNRWFHEKEENRAKMTIQQSVTNKRQLVLIFSAGPLADDGVRGCQETMHGPAPLLSK